MDAIFQELRATLEAGSFISLFAAVILAYVGGVLSSFTPCVYPLIPITVSFIGGAKERTIKDGFFLSLFYVVGMACVYTALGLAASLSGKIFGSLTNTSGWYLALGAIMTLCSLWMFEIIKFDPNVWVSKFSKSKGRKSNDEPLSLIGAFLLGSSSGFIASPCTTPALTVILSFIATQKSVAFGAILMMSFALGLGTILVVIGTFTGALKLLPRSGKWLNTVKIISGLAILLLGQYFVYKAGSR